MERIKLKDEPNITSTILNKELIKKFCKYIKMGMPADGVCDYLGINPSTYWSWMKKGQIFIDGNGEPVQYKLYGLFIVKFRKACAAYRLHLIKTLHAKSSPNWVRDITILERRDRKNFSRFEPLGGADSDYDPDERFL